MLRRAAASALILFVLTGFVLAGEYTGLVTKITDDSVTFLIRKKGEKPEEKVFKNKKAKITKEDEKLTATELSDLIKESKGKTKGVRAKITTTGEDDNEAVTKIEVRTKKKL